MHTKVHQISTQGIILKAIPYKDFHRIITLFSPDQGLISLVVRGAFSAKKGNGGSTSPLTTVEVAYAPKDASMYNCDQIDIIDLHLPIRQNLEALEAAGQMLMAVSKSQLPNKAAPLLYQLLQVFIKKLYVTQSPKNLSASFLLKLLRHEGFLEMSDLCPLCHGPLGAVTFHDGEFVCKSHKNSGIYFSPEEFHWLLVLAMSTTYSDLIIVPFSRDLKEKIEKVFSFFIS